MRRRPPSWACPDYEQHGEAVCPECLGIYDARGQQLERWDTLPPRTSFGEGWFSMGAVHWFPATNDTVFPSRDGKRVLAQAICGSICEVTITWAPKTGRACRKCLRALEKGRPSGDRRELH